MARRKRVDDDAAAERALRALASQNEAVAAERDDRRLTDELRVGALLRRELGAAAEDHQPGHHLRGAEMKADSAAIGERLLGERTGFDGGVEPLRSRGDGGMDDDVSADHVGP